MSATSESGARVGSQCSTSRSLVIRLQNDDAPAWQDVIRLYSPLVMHWCRRAGLPEQECPDVVQEVFRSVHKGIPAFRRDMKGATFRGWLRTIARNKVMDHFRSHGKQPVAIGGSEAGARLANVPDLDDDPIDDEQNLRAEHELYLRALELVRRELKPKTWQAFQRVVIEGEDTATVAEALNMKPGAVRVAKSRVLKRLREQLGDLFD